MFSGGSIPSRRAHSRKNRQGTRSCEDTGYRRIWGETEIELTFNHTMMRFQKPIKLSSAALVPCHALVSLMATTYMKGSIMCAVL